MADEQFNPEALKAQYLADQHGIDRDSYLKEGLSDNEFIAQYGDKPIEAPAEAQTFEPSTEEDAKAGYMNPVLGAGVGALAGVKAAPYVGELNAAKYVLDKLDTLGQNKGVSARQPAPASRLFDVPNNLPSTEFASPELTVSEAGYSNPHGYGEPAVKSANINQDISTVHANARGMGTMGNEAPLAEGFSREANNRVYTPHGADINPSPAQLTAMRQLEMDKMRQAQAQKTAQAHASEAAKQEAVRAFRAKEGASRALNAPPEASKGSPTVRQRLGNVMQPSGFGGKLLTTALTPAAGAAAGYLGTDAFNRYAEGDKTQAAISGTGALSSLAALHPQLRGKAAGLAALAPIVNYLIDKSTGHHPGEPRAPQSGGVTYTEPEHHAEGGSIQHFGLGGTVLKGILDQSPEIMQSLVKKFGYDVEPKKLSEVLAPHQDKYLGLTQSDNYGIHEGRMGGNRFPALQHEIPKQADDSVVWMNDTNEHADAMAKNSTVNGKPTVWSTYIGAPDQLKSNKSVYDQVMDSHYNRDISSDQANLLNNRIATLTSGSGKDKKLVFPQAFDIRDKFAAKELGGDTFARRGALMDMIGTGEGVGKTKSGIILPNYQNILNENRDPLTEGVGTSSIGSRLFTVDPKLSQHSPGVYHPDYEWPVYGEDLNTPFNFTPHSVLDWYDRQFNKVNKAGKTGVVPHGNSWFNYMKNPQYIDDKFLTKLQNRGFAHGGLASVKKFDGGGEVEATLPPVNVTAPRPSQSEMNAYLATHDENTGAPKDALGDFFSGKANLSDSLTQAGKELSNFPKPTNLNKVPSLDDPEVQAAMAFAPMGLGVVKNPGGTWLPDAVNELTWDAKARLAHSPANTAAKSVKNWYDTVLNKYVQNRMGSPSDEIRKLADQGISHVPTSKLEAAHANIGADRIVKSARTTSGFPEEGLATSPLGKLWEYVSDAQIESKPRKFINSGTTSEMPGIEKLSPEDLVHYNRGLNPENLGFNHIGDMLESDIAAGKLTPEQLAQMSVEKAVRRTHGYNQAQNAVAQAASEALPTVKEYPTGFHWKELTHQDPETLKSILKKEGDTMQNCIGGYCENVLEDGTKLYSLRDAAGNPHANVEVRQNRDGSPMINQIKGKQNAAPSSDYQQYVQDFVQNPIGNKDFSVVGDLENTGLIDVAKLKQHGLTGGSSRFDRAHSAELSRIFPTEVGPYGGVQMSGPHGTSLPEYYKMKQLVQDIPHKFVSPQQLTEHLQGFETRPIEQSYSKYYAPEGMALGGKVGAIKSLIDAAPQLYQGAKDLILPPAENAARTQIIGTLPTYQKASDMFQKLGATGKPIDFGAGLGEGAKIMGADTFEPYAKNWTPTYTNAADIPSDAYGKLTNLNVLNVMPREMRDQTVSDIGRVMDKGGLGILTTRGNDVMKAQGRPGPEPTSIITTRDTYQKGFNPQELEDYLKYILGNKFDINKLNLGPAGALIRKK